MRDIKEIEKDIRKARVRFGEAVLRRDLAEKEVVAMRDCICELQAELERARKESKA